MQNKSCSYYIDKTECLEEGIRRFPSIYIEGNAAIGKSVAVEMLLEKAETYEKTVFFILITVL